MVLAKQDDARPHCGMNDQIIMQWSAVQTHWKHHASLLAAVACMLMMCLLHVGGALLLSSAQAVRLGEGQGMA